MSVNRLFDSILITGGSGMLAHSLRRLLIQRGHHPTSVSHRECDITDAEQLRDTFRRHHPTLVLNCAAYTKVDQAEKEPEVARQINGRAVGRLAELCREQETRLVHYSTDFAFDGTANRPYRSDDITKPLSVYGQSKLLGERLLALAEPPGWLILRTSWLFGHPGHCFPKIILDRARQGGSLQVVDDQIGCPTYCPDLAQATLDLLANDAHGLYHVSNGGSTSWFGFAEAILHEFELNIPLTPISTAKWRELRPGQAIRPQYSVLDPSALVGLLGQPLRPWREALTAYRQEMTPPVVSLNT